MNELGRGRIWSGQDALTHGLIDELGDLHTGIQRACELSGLPYSAAIWTAAPRGRGPLPEFAQEAASMNLMAGLLPAQGVLMLLDSDLKVK